MSRFHKHPCKKVCLSDLVKVVAILNVARNSLSEVVSHSQQVLQLFHLNIPLQHKDLNRLTEKATKTKFPRNGYTSRSLVWSAYILLISVGISVSSCSVWTQGYLVFSTFPWLKFSLLICWPIETENRRTEGHASLKCRIVIVGYITSFLCHTSTVRVTAHSKEVAVVGRELHAILVN